MSEEKQIQMALMKIEVKLALDIFKEKYKKSSKGIEQLYSEIILTNDLEEVKKNYTDPIISFVASNP